MTAKPAFAIERVRCIITYRGGIVLIKRVKIIENKTVEYYVFPGGAVEKGETLEEALHREVKEELGIKIKIVKKLYTDVYGSDNNSYFLCEHMDGEIGAGDGPEFHAPEYLQSGQYIPVAVPFAAISKINLVPNLIRDNLAKDLESILVWACSPGISAK